jgi:nucleotide-binding universal stress UspA family protein
MFHNILVGIDGTPASERALDQAIDLARGSHARLTILTAVGRMPAMAAASADAAAVVQLRNDLERAACKLLDDAVARIPDEIPVTKIVSHESVRSAILTRVRSGCHDLVVIGSRGRTGLRATVLGSTSRDLVPRCEVPVLVVHDDHAEPAGQASSTPPSVPVARPRERLA